jgi:hypothetical protein
MQALVDTAADDAERSLLTAVAAAGVPLPEQGYETDDGYPPPDLARPDVRVAALINPDDSVTASG